MTKITNPLYQISRVPNKVKTSFSKSVYAVCLSWKQASIVFVLSLILVFGGLALSYPPLIIHSFMVYVVWHEGLYAATSMYMLPSVYIAIFFLISSVVHLRRKTEDVFRKIPNMISIPRKQSDEFAEHALSITNSRVSYLFSVIFVAFLWALELGGLRIEAVYINKPMLAYFLGVYSTIIFIAGLFIWMYFTATYEIYKSCRLPFRTDLTSISNWIRRDRIGGIRSLSDLSLRFVVLFVFGVLLFSPAPLLYGFYLYAFYVFAILVLGIGTFFLVQFTLHRTIVREKKQILNKAEKELADDRQIEYVHYLEHVSEWCIDPKIVLTLSFSTMLWPIILWYLSSVLRISTIPIQ